MKTYKIIDFLRVGFVLSLMAASRAAAQTPPESVLVTNLTVVEGQTAVFNLSAVGRGPLSYQWIFEGIPISVSNVITTVAGKTALAMSYAGDNGAATNAGLWHPSGVAVDQQGNFYIADQGNTVIRKVDTNNIITTVAGNFYLGQTYSGDGGAATNAGLFWPNDVTVDGAGNLFIADTYNNVIRRVDAAGTISTVAGSYILGGGYSGDGGAATEAALYLPYGLALDGAGNLYIAENGNNVVRKMDTNGLITTVAGNFALGGTYFGDGGPATNAGLSWPNAVAVDGLGNLYIADSGNQVVRKVDTNAIITTVAGKFELGGGYSGDGGPATNSALASDNGVAADVWGDIFIADTGNNLVRQVDAGGVITTVAGNFSLGGGLSSDGGAATNVTLKTPIGAGMDDAGNLYIADAQNGLIRKVTFANFIGTIEDGALTIPDVRPNLAGHYQVVISNPYGSITSSIVTLTVLPSSSAVGKTVGPNKNVFSGSDLPIGATPALVMAPSITIQPTNQTVVQGSNATFSVTASGSPLNYQWAFNGTNFLAGRTNATLTITNASSATNAGYYTVTITNTAGSATSSNALLTVLTKPVISAQPTNAAAVVGSTATFAVTASGGALNYLWRLNGTNLPAGQTNAMLTLTNIATTNAGNYSVVITNLAGSVTSSNALLTVVTAPVITAPPTNQTIAAGSNVTFSVTVSGALLNYQWEFNGTTPLAGQTNATLTLTGVGTNNAGTYSVIVTNLAGSVTSSNALLTVITPPLITVQPTNVAAVKGSTAGFSVTASGPSLRYQWLLNGTNLPSGQTNASLTLTNIGTTNAGNYSVVITNLAGSVTSSNAVLTVIVAPTISAEPTNLTVIQGNNATFGVTAAGGALNYQWWFAGTNALAGQTNATVTLTNIGPANAGNYFVVITNLAGLVTSSNGLLTVLVPLAIASQPASETVRQGSNAVFSVTAAGSTNLAYQWWFNGSTGLAGRTNASLTITNAATTNAGNYTVVVTNLAGATTSSVAALTVLVAPTITTQPASQAEALGGTAIFSVTAAGGGLNYQWRFNTTNQLAGQTNSALTITNIQTANGGNYSVTITNLAGSVTSSNALLTVVSQPQITVQPTNVTVAQGSNAVFSVSATNGTLGYQWWFNTTNLLAGGAGSALTVTNASGANAGNYFVIVTNVAGSATSATATLIVLTPPVITQQPTNEGVNLGATAQFSVTATGATPFSYDWLFNGSPIMVTNIITTVAGNHTANSPGNGVATNVSVTEPFGVTASGAGGFFICQYGYSVVQAVSASGALTRFAGNGGNGYSGDGSAATNAELHFPKGAALDSLGNLYIADSGNNLIRKVSTNGIITTVAGTNSLAAGYSGDGGSATMAKLNCPTDVAVDGSGNLYITDSSNNVIRKVSSSGIISTVAGNHSLGGGFSGDGGAATNAQLYQPEGVTVDANGNLYIADSTNQVVRKVSGGVITTIAGNGSNGYSGDGGPATSASLGDPYGVALDAAGNLYIANYNRCVVRMVNPAGIISTVAGQNSLAGGYSGNGGLATSAALYCPMGVTVDSAGNLEIADFGNNVIRRVTLGALDGAGSVQGGQLTLTNAQPYMAGNYQLIISNPYGNTTSSIASLTVSNPPVITVQPTSQIAVQGSNAVFSVTAAGSALSYQWWYNGTNRLAGQTNASLTLTNVGSTNIGFYGVVVTNIYGSVTSSNATLTELLGNYTWVGGTSTNWSVAANWSPAGVPGIGAEANISNGGTVSLTTNVQVGYLNLVSGTINGPGVLSASNAFNWTGGNVYCPVSVRTNATLTLGGSGNLSLYSGVTNAGTMNWTGTCTIQVYNGQNGWTGGFVNLASGVFYVQNDQLMNGNDGLEYFNNAGLVQKSPTTQTTTLGVIFNNTGTVQVESGTIAFDNGGILAGSFQPASSGTIDLNGGLFIWNGSPVFSGAGVAESTGGSIVLTGTVTNVAPVNISVTGVSNAVMTGTIALTNCAIIGPVIVEGALTLSGGGISAGCSLLVATNGSLSLEDGVSLYGVLTNLGTVDWIGANDLEIYNDGNANTGGIVNGLGAVFNVQNDQSMTGNLGYEYFNNEGLLVKYPTVGATVIDVAFANTPSGAVDVDSGTMVFEHGGSLAGNFLAAAGTTINFSSGNFALSGVFNAATNAAIDFNSGSYTWNGNPLFEGAGQVQFGTGGTVLLTGAVTNVSFANMTIGGLSNLVGTANLTNCVVNDVETVAGTVNWSAGQFNANETIAGTLNWSGGGAVNGGLWLAVAGNGVVNLEGAVDIIGALTNAGTVNWTGAGTITVGYTSGFGYGNSGAIVNLAGGVFNIANDQTIADAWGASSFYNSGTVVKTALTNTTYINVPFYNFANGLVNAESGTISFQGGGSLSGIFEASTNAAVSFGGGNFTGSVPNFEGPGFVGVAGGNVDLSGSGGALTVTNGTLAGTVGGTVNWIDGEIDNNATLTVAPNGVLNIEGSAYVAGTLTNAGTVNWTGTGTIVVGYYSGYGYGSAGGIVNLPGGVFNLANDETMDDYWGGSYFYNSGTLLKTALTNTTYIEVAFYNFTNGVVNAESGTIDFAGGGGLSGIFEASTNAAVSFGGGNFTGSMPNFEGPGFVGVAGGNVDLSGSGGALTVTNGTLAGMVGGTVNWIDGEIDNNATLTVASNGVLNIEGSAYVAGTLTNAGTVNWTGTGTIVVGYYSGYGYGSAGGIVNLAGGVFNLANDETIDDYWGGSYFYNAGTLLKTALTNTTYIEVAFYNFTNGVVNAESGTIDFAGGGCLSGIFEASTNAAIDFSAGSFSTSGPTFQGPGEIIFGNGVINGPLLVFPPESAMVDVGSVAEFSVTAAGSPPFSYAWYFNGTNLLAETNSVLVLSDVQVTNDGDYTVVVANSYGSVTSSNAALTVRVLPDILVQPNNVAALPGSNAVFSVVATNGTLSYQWFEGTNLLAGRTNSTLTLTNVQLSAAGSYLVVVTNIFGSVASSNALLTVATQPIITLQPAGATIAQGGSATFAVTATGGALSYQWWLGSAPLPGQTGSSLTVTNAQPANAGSYFVVVTNLAGTATSGNAALTVVVAPTFTAEPADQTVVGGNTAVFSVTTAGSAAQYQWWFGGTLLPGATNATLTIPNVQATNAGYYSVVATNLAGSAASSNATLTVLFEPVITAEPTNLAAIAGGTVLFSVSATGGDLFYQWWFNGTNAISGATSATLTLTSIGATQAGAYSVVVTNLAGSAASSNALLAVCTTPAISSQPASLTIDQGSNAIFSVTATGGALNYQWSLDGAPVAGATNASLVLTDVQPSSAGLCRVVVTNIAGSVASANAVLTVLTPPAITSQPANVAAVVGSSATFAVTATGGDLAYTWWFNLTNLVAGATNATLSLTNLQMAEAGAYSVFVSNMDGSVTSSNAVLTICATPMITSEPASVTVDEGSNAVFTVIATGGALNYQWSLNGLPLAGATNASLVLTDVQTSNAGLCSVVVTNLAGSVTSSNAVLTVLTTPAITAQPTNQTVALGGSATFAVTATGGDLAFAWWFNQTNLLAGATNATLTFTNLQVSSAGSYSVLVSNMDGSATSSNALLTVCTTPVITSQPANEIVNHGGNAVFSVTAAGGALHYLWMLNGAALPWATNATVVLTNVQPANAGSCQVVVTNLAGAATSSNALLTVVSPPAITLQPANQVAPTNGNATFTVAATGGVLNYSWWFEGTNQVAGATNATLMLTDVQLSNAGLYDVVVSNMDGSVTSSNAALTVCVAPEIITQPVGQTANQNGNAFFTVTATGGALTYFWWLNGTTLVSVQTTPTLELTNVPAGAAGYYSVVASNLVGTAASSNAGLTVLPPLAITTEPVNQEVVAGLQTATFSAAGTGTGPLSWQWYSNNVPLAGAQSNVLTFVDPPTNCTADYYVALANDYGAVTSTIAVLQVDDALADSDYDGRNNGQELLTDGTDPYNPNSVISTQLAYLPFDDTNAWAGGAGQLPLLATNVLGIPSWDTNAAWIDSTNPAILCYRDVETNGAANINLRAGTVSFWFKPDWSSADVGGTGPGGAGLGGRLLEMGVYNAAFTNGWWSLYVTPDGNQMVFGSSTNGAGGTLLTAPIAFLTNQWCSVVITYTPTNSQLYVNSQLIGAGAGPVNYPNLAERSAGFTMGSDAAGNNQARGVYDDLGTYNYALSSAAVASYYQACISLSSGGGMNNILANELGLNPYAYNSPNGLSSTNALEVFTPLQQ